MRIWLATLLLSVLSLARVDVVAAVTQDSGVARNIGVVHAERGRGGDDEEVYALVTQAFVASRSFGVVERSRLDKIIEEQKLQSFVGEDVQILADLAGLSHLALINYTTERDDETTKYSIVLRIVDVTSGEVGATIRSEAGGWKDFTTNPLQTIRQNPFKKSGAAAAADLLAAQIRREFPVEGYVVRITGSEIVVDLGTAAGLKKGDVFLVLEQAEPIVHPVTGVTLPGEVRVVAELKVASASEAVSITTVKGSAKRDVLLGDRVRFKTEGMSLRI